VTSADFENVNNHLNNFENVTKNTTIIINKNYITIRNTIIIIKEVAIIMINNITVYKKKIIIMYNTIISDSIYHT